MTYDLVIVGGSAAGAAAAVYAARRKLNLLMISDDFGGEVANSGEVWNYPGVVQTTGVELAEMFRAHIAANNVEPILQTRIESISKNTEGIFVLSGKCAGKDVIYESKAVIVATGVHPRHLDVPGESALYGKGVTYCTTCDGPLYRKKRTVTIGGGNSALESALMMAELASAVTVINIHPDFRGEQVLIDKVLSHPRITVISSAKTQRIEGETRVTGVVYLDTDGAEHRVECDGVFVHIGMIPNSALVPEGVHKNVFKEIEVNMKCQTSVPGLFAAGDVTTIPYKQIGIATGQGITAALAAIEYLNARR